MVDEEWVWTNITGARRKEIDPDLVLDPSMHGRFRYEQIDRWRQEPHMFMMRDIAGLTRQDPVAMRRDALFKQEKEGTQNDRRADDPSNEGQEED